jgi:hypothetical protein
MVTVAVAGWAFTDKEQNPISAGGNHLKSLRNTQNMYNICVFILNNTTFAAQADLFIVRPILSLGEGNGTNKR